MLDTDLCLVFSSIRLLMTHEAKVKSGAMKTENQTGLKKNLNQR